jgi:hypothetical protein
VARRRFGLYLISPLSSGVPHHSSIAHSGSIATRAIAGLDHREG